MKILRKSLLYFRLNKSAAIFNLHCVKHCIWKYLFSLSGSYRWQDTSYLGSFALGQIMISDSQLFFIAQGFLPDLYFVKITFENTSVDWANIIYWSYATCNTDLSESILSSDGLSIYSFFIYGDSINYFLFYASFLTSDGSVLGNRYISNINWNIVSSSAENGEYVAVIVQCTSSSYLILFNTSKSTFITKVSSSNLLYGCSLDQTSER